MKILKMNFRSIVSCLAILLLVSACNQSGQPAEKSGSSETKTVKIDGSSTVYPISEAVAEEFRNSSPEVRVTVGLSGTGGGFKMFARGETDINNASRPIKEAEAALCQEKNIAFLELEVAYDGLVIVVNPQNTWCKNLKVSELKKLWEPAAQGKITHWNQIRPEFPKEEIHLFGAGVESGTYDYFTEVIVGESHSSRGDYTASEDDNVLVQGVSSDKLALGFFGLAYYEENKEKLHLVAIDDENDQNGKGPILPNLEMVKNKTYAPLARPLFIYVNSQAAKRQEVQDFIGFYLDNMQALSQEVGYVSLNEEEVSSQKTKWEDFLKSLTSNN